METDSYKSRKKGRALTTAIVIIVMTYLIGVASWDAFIANPRKTDNIERIYIKFSEFKTYMDAKIPLIDSTLNRHEILINDQNLQLIELNTLTAVLKEENKE